MRQAACLACFLFLLTFPAGADAQIAKPWPEADRLFRSDPLWLGGDAAFSVDLGRGRVLWLFGDSFVGPALRATRQQSTFVRNSIAVETGYDPSQATIKFYEGRRNGGIGDFAPTGDQTWLWPLDGIRLGHRLLLFYMRIAPDPTKFSLGFRPVGWTGFLIDNPDAEPSRWALRNVEGPEMHGRMLIGMSLIRLSGYVYAFALERLTHDAYLLRWPVRDAAQSALSAPQWWCGARSGWLTAPERRQAVIEDAGAEFSVQSAPRGAGFIEVNSAGFGATTIVWRHAAHLEGPWSEAQALYRPPESAAHDALVYGAKSHPELAGADLVLTYTANGPADRVVNDMSLYFPRFVRVDMGAPHKQSAH